MDLREAGVGEESAAFVRAPAGGDVGALGVGGEKEYVAVAAGAEDDGIAEVSIDLAGDEIARDDAARSPVDDDEIEHFGAGKHGDGARLDLALERLVSAEKKLLAGLAARVERARNLRAAEGAIGQACRRIRGRTERLVRRTDR